MRFVGGNVNPCLCMKKSAKGVLCTALYLDDNSIVGTLEALDEAIKALQKVD